MTKSIPIQQILLDQIQIPTKLLSSYTTLGLNEKELTVILQLHRFLQEKNDFPTPFEIASHLTIDEKECANILRKLIQKNVLEIEQKENDQKQRSEAYCLNPLWEKIYATAKPEVEQTDGTIFILFEQEFGRPLSPFEIETINAWLDDDEIAPSLIKAGLRESVLMGKLNFKYIDRILRDWMKKGIKTVDQARNASRNFHNNQSVKQETTKKRDTSFYYNWLEGED
ncbi:DNA replication protein DnaD [Virgibacillus profundi]|uniref:DNA replication protein DnaD n=1 Tax=Virgibacillus profundi TaxID=2024555 RepID=A0A2A2IDM1_9BACI|nr:DnaD domain-containing protein [Virgibacillus profundi]PAV29468.1 DNA replication protein DnaD [Virgibacillus profundi]PXY53637.1 DnaD domain protein [Virgibacillus profundi]